MGYIIIGGCLIATILPYFFARLVYRGSLEKCSQKYALVISCVAFLVLYALVLFLFYLIGLITIMNMYGR